MPQLQLHAWDWTHKGDVLVANHSEREASTTVHVHLYLICYCFIVKCWVHVILLVISIHFSNDKTCLNTIDRFYANIMPIIYRHT